MQAPVSLASHRPKLPRIDGSRGLIQLRLKALNPTMLGALAGRIEPLGGTLPQTPLLLLWP